MSPGRTGTRRSSSPGYTLIEVIVAVALLVVIAAIVTPILTRERTSERVARAEVELEILTDALDAFAEDVREWPPSLDQLVTPLVSGDRDICGSTYNGGERSRWAGPYLSRPIAAGGLPVGIGTASNTFTLSGGTDIDFLHLSITAVEEADAVALNERVDGDDDAAAGAVRWTVTGSGQVTVTWRIPIQPC